MWHAFVDPLNRTNNQSMDLVPQDAMMPFGFDRFKEALYQIQNDRSNN